MSTRHHLHDRWVDTIAVLGGDADVARRWASELVERYANPGRHYHDLDHVEQVTTDAEWLASEEELDDRSRSVVVLAALAHDVVYDGHPGEDERRSSEWALAALLDAGVDAVTAEAVAALVLATTTHEGRDISAAVLMDADLAILAATPDRYRRYVDAVRREYAAFDDATWAAGRSAMLNAFVERPRIYTTEPARRRWEDAARRNIGAELTALRAARGR